MSDSETRHSRYTAIFASGTLLSRLLGLVRDFVWVLLIPVASRDAFIVAFKFPNMLRDLVGEGASNAAFIPVLSESLEKDSEKDFQELVSAMMSAMLLILVVLTVLGIVIIPLLLSGLNALGPLTRVDNVPQDRIDLMTTLAVWTFPYLMFIGMAVFCMGPLFAKGHYSTPSWSPALLNVAIILVCLLFADSFPEPAYALVVGVWLGGLAQLGAQYIALGKVTGVWIPNFRIGHPGVRTALWLLVPVLIGQSAGELNKLVDMLFAASLPTGTVTALYYSNRLVQLPLSVFGIATAVAILPSISRAAALDDDEEIRVTLMHGLRRSLFLVLPAMIGLIVLATPIIRLLFEYGHFGPQDTARTTTALVYYGAGLLSFAWVKVSVSGFYAVQDTKTPVVIASCSMLLNVLLNCVLVGPLGFKGLALATTISFTVNFVFLFLFLSMRFGTLWNYDFGNAVFRIVVATCLMTVVVYGVSVNGARFFPGDALGARAMAVFLPMGAGFAAYAALSAALDIVELKYFTGVFRRD